MPNHVLHVLTVRGPKVELERMIEYVASASSAFSFQCIVPMPEALENTELVFKSNESGDERGARQRNEEKLRESYRHINWYDWSVANWGTKWDAYDGPQYELSEAKKQEFKAIKSYEEFEQTQAATLPEDYAKEDWWEWNSDEEIVGSFSTAWCPATPVYAALAARFPQLSFTYAYAEEFCYFVEKQCYENGGLVDQVGYDPESSEGIAIRESVGLRYAEDEEETKEETKEEADPFANLVTGFPADNSETVEIIVSSLLFSALSGVLSDDEIRREAEAKEIVAAENEEIAKIEAEEVAEELRREFENDEIAEIEAEELYRDHADEPEDDYYRGGSGEEYDDE